MEEEIVSNRVHYSWLSFQCGLGHPKKEENKSVCKVRTQEAENFDEEVKSLVSAWRLQK